MRESCITLYSTIIQALQQLFLQQIIHLHTRPPALTLNLQDPAHSPQRLATQQHQRQDCGPGGSAKARCFLEARNRCTVMKAWPQRQVRPSPQHMHMKVAIDGRVCAPYAAKLIAKWPPPIAFTACNSPCTE